MNEFKAKIGLELLIPVTLLHIFIMAKTLMNGSSVNSILGLGSILLASLAFIFYLFFNTKYFIFENYHLVIKNAFFPATDIDIHNIKEIEKSNSILASPAPSLDRISLKIGKYDEVLISPKNKKEFIEAITKINPSVIVKIQ